MNMTNKIIKNGVCIFEILDHFPTFFIVNRSKILYSNKIKFKIFMKQFKIEKFLLHLKNNLSKLNLRPSNKTNINQDVINLTTRL